MAVCLAVRSAVPKGLITALMMADSMAYSMAFLSVLMLDRLVGVSVQLWGLLLLDVLLVLH